MRFKKSDIQYLNQQAIDYFGITDNPLEAGYLLEDGQMLDFSGKRDVSADYRRADNNRYYVKSGKQDYLKNERATDHRQIANGFDDRADAILLQAEVDFESDSKWMCAFMAITGAIRLSVFEHHFFAEMVKKPTDLQIKKLMWMIFPNMSITLEHSNPKTGRTLDYFQADRAIPIQIELFAKRLKPIRSKKS